jgi:hypothetical protein
MVCNDENVRQNQAIQYAQNQATSNASNAKTQAGISSQFEQANIAQGRGSLEAQKGLNKQSLAIQQAQLGQAQSNLNTNQSLSNQGISLKRQELNLSRQETLLSRFQIDVDRISDVFSKSLLPDLKNQLTIQSANQARINSLLGINLQQTGEDFARGTQNQINETQYAADTASYKSGLEEIPANYKYQRKAEDAAYLSSLGSSSTQAEAALAALASANSGLLSQVGTNLSNGTYTGYQAPSNSMGKFASALGSVGGFMSSLQGYLGNRNTSSSSVGSNFSSNLYSGTTGLQNYG